MKWKHFFAKDACRVPPESWMGDKMKTSMLLLPLVLGSAVAQAESEPLDWRLSFGIHDFQVESSDAFGAHAAISLDTVTDGGIKLHANLNTYLDRDKDKLDPDHIPIWFQSSYFARGKLFTLGEDLRLDWQATLSGKRNTVSSIEKQITLYPSLVLDYHRPAFGANLEAGIGYYFLEIDDDVPKERGYQRGDFGNDATAWMLSGGGYLMLAPGWTLSASATHWSDGSERLETRYGASLSVDTHSLLANSVMTLSFEQNQYNLDHYDLLPKQDDRYLPILPWDTDSLFRLYLTLPW